TQRPSLAWCTRPTPGRWWCWAEHRPPGLRLRPDGQPRQWGRLTTPHRAKGDGAVIIGVPREIKSGEQRVALTPAGAHVLAEAGHRVLVEPDAGAGSSFRDEEYAQVGAALRPAEALWAEAELILNVKEPIPADYGRPR